MEVHTHGQSDDMSNVIIVIALCFLGSTNNQSNHGLTQPIFYIVVGNVCGPGELCRYGDLLRARRSGDRILVEARISSPFQTGPGFHPVSCTMGTGTFLGVKWLGRGVDRALVSIAEVKKE